MIGTLIRWIETVRVIFTALVLIMKVCSLSESQVRSRRSDDGFPFFIFPILLVSPQSLINEKNNKEENERTITIV